MKGKYYTSILEQYRLLVEKASEEDIVAIGSKIASSKSKASASSAIKAGPSGPNNMSKFNNALKGTEDNIELKKELYNNLPPSPDALPAVEKDQLGNQPNYKPFIIRSMKSDGKPAASTVSWNTDIGPIKYPLSTKGGIGDSYNYASFRDYLATLLSEETGEEKEEVKGASPYAGDVAQNLVRDSETGNWINKDTGEIIENPWFSWEPDDMQEIFSDAKDSLGIIPGLSLRKIFYLITSSPESSTNEDLRTFKRGLRGGYDPNVPVEAQKEIYEGFRDLLSIASIVKVDDDGTHYIDESRLKKSSLDLLNAITYKTGEQLFIGHNGSDGGRVRMPVLYDMLDSVAANVEDDRSKGVTLAGSTSALGEALGEVVIKREDGTSYPAIRDSIFSDMDKQSLRQISKNKESLVAGLMNHLLGIDKENSNYAETAIKLKESLETISDLEQKMESGIPVGCGVLSGESPSKALEAIMAITGTDNIKDGTLELVRETYIEASIMTNILNEAGVSVESVGGVDDISKIGKRDDFKVVLSDTEDYAKLNDYFQSKHGIDLNISKDLPISLKAYFSSSRDYSAGTTSLYNSMNAFDRSNGDASKPDMVEEGGINTYQSFDTYIKESKFFKDLPEATKNEILASKNEAAKSMSTITKGVLGVTTSNKATNAPNFKGVIKAFSDMVLSPDSGIEPDEGKKIMDDLAQASNLRDVVDGKRKNTKAAAHVVNAMRKSMGRNTKTLKGLGYNDLISTVFTEDDEAMVHAMGGNVRISGHHAIVSYLLQECEPEMNSKGTIVWRKRDGEGKGRSMYRTLIREKGGTLISDGRANPALFAAVGKLFYGDMKLNESLLTKENVIGKLEEILTKINEVFTV